MENLSAAGEAEPLKPVFVSGKAHLVKTILDVTSAALLIFVTFPVFAIIWLLVRHDGGPGFYKHRRIGQHGVPFSCLKFRTMLSNSDQVLAEHLASNPEAAREWLASRKLTRDPRVTRIGKFLRRTSLDELPQLLNVLCAEMSLVGPRPVVQEELRYYGQNLYYYETVRPGITGLWQISGRSDTSYDDRVALDTRYVREWSLWLDLVILVRTLPAVLSQRGAR
ncbi:sugar transferase [Acetobacter oeni]|uniref:sugar transferase n=1 Tax=Acetobacter oeni TaxID=304077 RepID=UPI0011BE1F17|nr:sugar transferase [Acetobacter oeni]MBB3881255.1 undecaprenyl-phosphate galactose phosphotransferase [Acetobacter oeni]NHO18130.1 sugar transferase [Acetobacter oeni]